LVLLYSLIHIYFIPKMFIHNRRLKLLIFITFNELLCSLVITLSNYLYKLCETD